MKNSITQKPAIKILLLLLLPAGLYFLFFFMHPPLISPVTYFILCTAYVICVFRKGLIYTGNRRSFVLSAVFSFFFSLMLDLKSHIVFSGITRGRIDTNYFTPAGAKDIVAILCLGFILFFILLNLLDLILYILHHFHLKNLIGFRFQGKKWILVFFILLVLIWGISYLAMWPGTSMWNDIDAILKHGPIGESFRSPVLYNLVVDFFLEVLCDPLTNPNLGFGLFALFQLLLMAAVVTYVLWWTYAVAKIRSAYTVILFLFFAFYPVIGLYAFSIVKDTPYALCMLLCIPFLYDLIREQKIALRNKILFFIIAVCSIACRNNGKIFIPLLIIITILFVRKCWKFLAIAGASVLVILTLSTGLLTKNVPYRFTEAVGMQLQQVAAVLSYDGRISDEDREFLYQIKDEEYWVGTDTASYSPMIVDPLKMTDDDAISINSYLINDDFLNAHRMEFLQVYLRTLVKNPSLCVKAWLMNSYGFWAYGTLSDEQAFMSEIHTSYYDYHRDPKLPSFISEKVQKYYDSLPKTSTGSAGTFIWLVLFMTVLLLAAKKGRYTLLMMPILLNWLIIMVFTPIAFGFRYVFYYLLIIPLLIFLLPGILKEKTQ